MKAKLNMWGENHEITFSKTTYRNNGNLAIQAIDEDNAPWCMVTTNLGVELPPNQAYLDNNNCSPEIIQWLIENKYAKEMGIGFSGFCTYTLVEFSDEFMKGE